MPIVVAELRATAAEIEAALNAAHAKNQEIK
jgi:hypothetical protein